MLFCFLTLFLLILALARPQTLKGKKNIKHQGVQMILAIDVSQSMMAEDIPPNRLSFLKKQLRDFLLTSPGNKLALLAFAGQSILISPFTYDRDLIINYLQDLSTDYISLQGTHFASVLKKSQQMFANQPAGSSSSDQVILLASDGEDHNQNLQKEIDELKKQNIRIFTLAVGSQEGSPIPIKSQKGQLIDYKKDRQKNVVISKLQTQTLKKLASNTQGGYYHLDYSNQALDKLKKDLGKLKKQSFSFKKANSKKEWFQYMLFLAFILSSLELLWSERKRIKL